MSFQDTLQRSSLPIPDAQHVGVTTYDAKDPDTAFPPIESLRPPTGAPNVLIVLIDDCGFGAARAFGGPISTPNAEELANGGLKSHAFSHPAHVHRMVVAPGQERLARWRTQRRAGVKRVSFSPPLASRSVFGVDGCQRLSWHQTHSHR